MNFLKNVDGLYDFYTEQDKTFDGSINALKNATGIEIGRASCRERV